MGDSWLQEVHSDRFLALFLTQMSHLFACHTCSLFTLWNSPRMGRIKVRNWLKIYTNTILSVELFLLLSGDKTFASGTYFSLQSFLLVFYFMAFACSVPE